MTTTKIEIVTLTEDTIAGGTLSAGTYLVEMPVDYDPARITGEDILLDPALRDVTGEVSMASVVECGNGFPDVGDVVGSDEVAYRVLRSGSRIETQGSGLGNICHGYIVEEVDWDDVSAEDDLFAAHVILDGEEASR